jgi:hypothetical protein
MPRYTPRNMDELRTCLGNCPADMPVEIERCVPVSARIVTELRSLPSWPHGLVLDVNKDPDPRFSVGGTRLSAAHCGQYRQVAGVGAAKRLKLPQQGTELQRPKGHHQ